MATRDDVVLDYAPTVRIAVVEAPSQEFVIQDVVDTLRKREDTFQGQTKTKLLNASGKENLGGGVSVGITAELLNTQIAFESRTDPAETGTVTTASGPPIGNSPSRVNGLIELHDVNALFTSTDIARGSLVINFTDQSIAEVYEVVSDILLITKTLVNGIDNSFDLGDVYHIFNVVQCEVIGGNIVGTDLLGNDLTPITPTAFTQIIRSASSSATIIGGIPSSVDNAQAVWDYDPSLAISNSMGQIQRRGAFNNHVHLDTNGGQAGTLYPIGTVQFPSNNIKDSVIIAGAEGFHDIVVSEDVTIKFDDNVDGFTIRGAHAIKSEIIIEDGASTQLTQFFNCQLTGTAKGRIVVREAVVSDLFNFEGILHQTAIVGTVRLSATPNAISYILDCYSGIPGTATPELDFDNTTHAMAIRAYNGGIKFVNKTTAPNVTVDFNSGQLILDGTVTAGETVVRGIYHIEDNSTGTATVLRNTNLDDIEIKVDNVQITSDAIQVTVGNMSLVIDDLIKYQRNKSIIDPANFTLTIYEDDGTTPLTTFDLQDDSGVASVLSIFRRIPQ